MVEIDLESFLIGVLVGAVCYLFMNFVYTKYFSSKDCEDHFRQRTKYGFSFDSMTGTFNSDDTGPKERGKARQALVEVIPELTLVDISSGKVLTDLNLVTFLHTGIKKL